MTDEVDWKMSTKPTFEIQKEHQDEIVEQEASAMGLEEARKIVISIMEDEKSAESAPMATDALNAAVVLKSKDAVLFAELGMYVKRSDLDMNLWKSHVKQVGREAISRARSEEKSIIDGPIGRPDIQERPELHIVVGDSCSALAEYGGIYERGGELVEIVEPLDGVKINPIQKGRVRELLSEAARFTRWVKGDDGGLKDVMPPTYVVDSVYARGTWPMMPQLKGFVDGACMLPDGTILTEDGFDEASHLYVRRGVDFSGKGLAAPTQKDAIKAYKHLTGLISDFELSKENRGAHEAAWVASLLTIIARPAIGQGATPMFLFDANRPRVGKTRLAQLACLIAAGEIPSPGAAPSGQGSDVEMGKTITGLARSGVPVIFFDNVKGKLGGPSLELAVTAARWSARVLGESTNYEGGLEVTWISTSNNCQLTPDMNGRTLLIRIETDLEKPEERTGFKHPRIMRHVRENRDEYLRSALILLRAWHLAGRPEFDILAWGSFEAWGDIIRNVILFAGGQDPCQTRAELGDTDAETEGLIAVLEAWPVGKMYSASQISKAMGDGYFPSDAHGGGGHDLSDALSEFLPSPKASRVGGFLRYQKDKVLNGRKLVQGSGRFRRHWSVEET